MFYYKLKNKLKLKHTHNLSWRSFLACLGSNGKCLGKCTLPCPGAQEIAQLILDFHEGDRPTTVQTKSNLWLEAFLVSTTQLKIFPNLLNIPSL